MIAAYLMVLLAASACADVAVNAGPEIVSTTTRLGQRVRGGQGHRHRRAACGSPLPTQSAANSAAVDSHNYWRSREPASNEIKLTWSGEMAALAQEWANTCSFNHGGTTDCSGKALGQNLFIEGNSPSTYPALNMSKAVAAWAQERSYWNFATGTCNTGKVCGHWSQVVDARTSAVGCGNAFCPTMQIGSIVWTNVLIVVCDYTPPGNVVGQPMYLPGTPCSNCDSDGTGAGYMCSSNLCAKCTPSANGAACKCGVPLSCQNGFWSPDACRCVCPANYFGLACEQTCDCNDKWIEPDGYNNCPDLAYYGYCEDEMYGPYMHEQCPASCNVQAECMLKLPPVCRV